MARYSKRVEKAEQINNNLFLYNFGNKFDKVYRPKDQFSQYDVMAEHNGREYYFELKNTTRYTIADFYAEGAMIEIDKWNYLAKLTFKSQYVYYLRFYADGYAVWFIPDLPVDILTKTFYTRKVVTVSNKAEYKQRDCLLLPFEKAMKVHRYSVSEMVAISKIRKSANKRSTKIIPD